MKAGSNFNFCEGTRRRTNRFLGRAMGDQGLELTLKYVFESSETSCFSLERSKQNHQAEQEYAPEYRKQARNNNVLIRSSKLR